MEASALQAPAGLARSSISIGAPLLRLRTDEQLVALFRSGHDEAFRVIHDRYRQRLFAYARQMLSGSRQDAEDALQDVFVRAYSGLRASDRQLALRAWLYRVAHNRCIDELRRPAPPAPEVLDFVCAPAHDPIAEAERRESLQRLVQDLRRLPDQQRSALLMRELSGMSYLELAGALGVSVPAVKSLLVRARVSLAQSLEARETACSEIREELIDAHDRRVRPNATARRHLRDCAPCREFRGEIRGVSRQFAALGPALGPAGVLANLLGWGSGAGAAGGAAGVGGSGVAAGGLLATGGGHVATLLAAAAVTVGGAVELQPSPTVPSRHPVRHQAARALRSPASSGPVLPTGPAGLAGVPGRAAPSEATGAGGVRSAALLRPGRASPAPSTLAGSGGSATGPASGASSGNFIDAQTGLGPMTGGDGGGTSSTTSPTPGSGASSPVPPASTSPTPPTGASAPAGTLSPPADGGAGAGVGATPADVPGISSAGSTTSSSPTASATTPASGSSSGPSAPVASSRTAEPASGSPSTSSGRSSATSRR